MPRFPADGLIEMDAAFFERVYAQVACIPSGRVATYGGIAVLAGYPDAAREVGIAMQRAPAPLQLPCHRVVNKNGTFAPSHAFGGQEHQRQMLEDEGVTFLPDGRINIDRHIWPDDPQGEQLVFF